MKDLYKNITSVYQEELIDNLKKFIKIDSTYDEFTKNDDNPFGKGVSEALNFICELAKKDGFEVHNYKNMVVEILFGNSDKNITIMAHADIVPVGSSWEHDPFDLFEKDGILYARGVADDKGPLLACYYGLKALKENDLLGNYQVRFLVGGNEESGSLGMEYYFHKLKKPMPTYGFSPDSSYPLIYAEKAIINLKLTCSNFSDNILSFKGGIASNSVIEKCELKVKNSKKFLEYLKHSNYDYSFNKDTFVFFGLAAHGSTPWLGKNAAIEAMKALNDCFEDKNIFSFVKLFQDCKGSGIKANRYSEDMLDNSLNIGLIELKDREIEFIINFRHGQTCTSEEIIDVFKQNSSPFSIEVLSISPLLYYSKESKLVKTLLNAYQQETNDFTSKPLTTGGGTYAKEADNVVAFGMEMPGFDSYMHSNKERTPKEVLFKSMAIYARAIKDLGDLL